MNRYLETMAPARPALLALAVTVGAAGGCPPPPAAADVTVRAPATTAAAPPRVRANEQAFARGFKLAVDGGGAALDRRSWARQFRAVATAGGGASVRTGDGAAPPATVGARREGTLTLNHAESAAAGDRFYITFRDTRGRPTLLAKDDIGVIYPDGAPRCFDLKRVDEVAGALKVDLVLDRSGSMQNALPAVRAAAARFMALLPDVARCRVTSFNGAYRRHTADYQACAAGRHALDSLKAEGATDLFGALGAVYDSLDRAGGGQRLVVVVTDGVGTANRLDKDALRRKKSATTFVFWSGDYEETALQGVADEAIYGRHELPRTLDRYFRSIDSAVRAQQVIVTKKACGS